jgi:hypothetical protein
VHHRTVSGAPEDSNSNSPPSGIFRGTRAIIHRTIRCTPDSVRCSKGEQPQELASFGNLQRLVHYNSPDMSGVHRTVRCNSGATATSRQRLPAEHLMRALRAQKSGVPILAHRTLNSGCPVRHRTSRRAQKSELQRSESNGIGDVAGAPDCPVRHRTDSLHQRSNLVVGAINTPTIPPFIASKFSTSQPLTRARHSILDTLKRSNPLQLHTRL